MDKVDQTDALLRAKSDRAMVSDFQLHERNLLPEPDWLEHTWIIRNIGRRQAIRAAWQTFRDAYEPTFQEFMDRQSAIADGEEAAQRTAG